MWNIPPAVELNRLKLLIVTQFYPPDYAATGQLIEELSHDLNDRGIQVDVFTGQPGYAYSKASAPAQEWVDQTRVRRSRTSRLWSKRIRGKAINGVFFCLRAFFHLLRHSRQYDVLLLTTAPPYLPVLGCLLHWLFRIPYVCLIYDLHPDIAIELNVVSQHHWIIRWWNYFNCQTWIHAQEVIVLSSTMRDRILHHCPTIADRISVIHNWSNPDWIAPLDKQNNWFAHQHNLVNRFTVLYSGNMGRCHDMETIFLAAIELRNDPVQFVFIGDGAKRNEFVQRVRAIGLTNCLFLPYQDQPFLPYSLTACDLTLVSVSEGMEGLVAPSKFYSSLATGVPVAVICEPHSYLRQIVNGAGCGDAFEHGDSAGLADFIRYLWHHPMEAKRMGMAGRHHLKTHFTLDRIGEQYAQVLYHAAGCRPKRSPNLPATMPISSGSER